MSQPPPATIVGVGATEFSKCSGRSELRLAVEACSLALADAGIAAAEVDGLVTFSIDHNDEPSVARNLGVDAVSFFSPVRRPAVAEAQERSRSRRSQPLNGIAQVFSEQDMPWESRVKILGGNAAPVYNIDVPQG